MTGFGWWKAAQSWPRPSIRRWRSYRVQLCVGCELYMHPAARKSGLLRSLFIICWSSLLQANRAEMERISLWFLIGALVLVVWTYSATGNRKKILKKVGCVQHRFITPFVRRRMFGFRTRLFRRWVTNFTSSSFRTDISPKSSTLNSFKCLNNSVELGGWWREISKN